MDSWQLYPLPTAHYPLPIPKILLENSTKLFRAPEGLRNLAGGGAKRNHRDRS